MAARGTARAFQISAVIIDDEAIATGNITQHQAWQYRMASINALISEVRPSIPVVLLQQGATGFGEFGNEPWWNGSLALCYDAVIQKGIPYAGDRESARLLRRQVYNACNLDIIPDTVLIVVHGNSAINHARGDGLTSN